MNLLIMVERPGCPEGCIHFDPEIITLDRIWLEVRLCFGLRRMSPIRRLILGLKSIVEVTEKFPDAIVITPGVVETLGALGVERLILQAFRNHWAGSPKIVVIPGSAAP